MLNPNAETPVENEVPLLPFGETLRLLLLGSTLNPSDLRFVLNKRGIYVKDARRENTIPHLASTILSPREFDILKNKQQFRESTIKVSDSKTTWGSDKTLVQALPDEIEPFVQQLVDESSPYQIKDFSVEVNHTNEVVLNCSIKRQDWTKDIFSSTSYHDCKLTISKDTNSDILIYRAETTAPETKDLMNKIQNATQGFFQEQGTIDRNTTVQRVLANNFIDNAAIYEFLNFFVTQPYDILTFKKISDIDAGIDQKFGYFPDNFLWLKDNIDAINLHGSKIHSSDVMKLGELGILVFGELEAEFGFDYSDAKGTCLIKYGFPNYYEKRGNTEFEAKVVRLNPFAAFTHVPKDRISRQLIQEFQRNKHQLFEHFISSGKANTQKRNAENQFEFEGYGW